MGSIQFKIQLEGITPPIWRTFQVDASEAFFDLHEIIQIVMGWENAHLFEFHINDRKIGLLPDEEQTWENPSREKQPWQSLVRATSFSMSIP